MHPKVNVTKRPIFTDMSRAEDPPCPYFRANRIIDRPGFPTYKTGLRLRADPGDLQRPSPQLVQHHFGLGRRRKVPQTGRTPRSSRGGTGRRGISLFRRQSRREHKVDEQSTTAVLPLRLVMWDVSRSETSKATNSGWPMGYRANTSVSNAP